MLDIQGALEALDKVESSKKDIQEKKELIAQFWTKGAYTAIRAFVVIIMLLVFVFMVVFITSSGFDLEGCLLVILFGGGLEVVLALGFRWLKKKEISDQQKKGELEKAHDERENALIKESDYLQDKFKQIGLPSELQSRKALVRLLMYQSCNPNMNIGEMFNRYLSEMDMQSLVEIAMRLDEQVRIMNATNERICTLLKENIRVNKEIEKYLRSQSKENEFS